MRLIRLAKNIQLSIFTHVDCTIGLYTFNMHTGMALRRFPFLVGVNSTGLTNESVFTKTLNPIANPGVAKSFESRRLFNSKSHLKLLFSLNLYKCRNLHTSL